MLSLTGLALGGVDFEKPAGRPELVRPADHLAGTAISPRAVRRRQRLAAADAAPLALAGVWDHSNFREDMIGRLRRTSQFVSVTTFGPTAEAGG